MKAELDKNFKKQFKLSFIKSIKAGFNVEDIKKSLKKQSYPSDLINKLIEEVKQDKNITKPVKLQEPKKQSFMQKIKDKLSKKPEGDIIKKVIKIHSAYYNLILENKRHLNESTITIDDILNNPENKKLINYCISEKEDHLKDIKKHISKIRKLARALVNQEVSKDYKNKVNKILEYTDKQEIEINKDIEDLEQIKTAAEDEIKKLFQKEKFNVRKKEQSLNVKINEISRKSAKFREALAQI